MKCNQCGTEFEGGVCPNCGTQNTVGSNENNVIDQQPGVQAEITKKPIYKNWWFWAIIAVLILVIVGGLSMNNDSVPSGTNTESSISQDVEEENVSSVNEKTSPKIVVVDFSNMSKSEIENWASENKVTCKFSEEYSDTVASGSVVSQSKKANETVKEGTTIRVVISKGKEPSLEFQNALAKAETYSELMHMSKKAIYDQLTSQYGEKFPADAAQYAIDNLNADYKENALEKAKIYQQNMQMSQSAIYNQLISEYGEKFTKEEAQYAIDHLND